MCLQTRFEIFLRQLPEVGCKTQALKLTLSLVLGIRLRHGAPLRSRAEPSHTVGAPVGGPDHIAALVARRILKAFPDQFDALHLFGLAMLQGGKAGEALRLITAALKIAPQSADAAHGA